MSFFWVLLKIAHTSRVYVLILYTHLYCIGQRNCSYISQIHNTYIGIEIKDPLVDDVRFHQEFGKRLGNGNINLQRCKQFPPWTTISSNQLPSPSISPKTELVFRIIAITFLGPFWSTCRDRFFSLILIPRLYWQGRKQWSQTDGVYGVYYTILPSLYLYTTYKSIYIFIVLLRHKGWK